MNVIKTTYLPLAIPGTGGHPLTGERQRDRNGNVILAVKYGLHRVKSIEILINQTRQLGEQVMCLHVYIFAVSFGRCPNSLNAAFTFNSKLQYGIIMYVSCVSILKDNKLW